jgi:predicted nuclease of predicted toxin-antitoxin system
VSEAAISLYLDENLSPKIAAQLRRRGITVVTAHELGTLGDTDENHLMRAREMGYVLCTQDTGYRLFNYGFAKYSSHRNCIWNARGSFDRRLGKWAGTYL